MGERYILIESEDILTIREEAIHPQAEFYDHPPPVFWMHRSSDRGTKATSNNDHQSSILANGDNSSTEDLILQKVEVPV